MDFDSAASSSRDRLARKLGIVSEKYDAETPPQRFLKHPGQMQAWESTKRIIGVVKGWQGGGTAIGAPWLLREIQRVACDSESENDFMIVTPHSQLLEKKALPEFMKLFQSDYIKGSDPTKGFGHYYPSKFFFEFSDWGMKRLFGKVIEPTPRVLMGHAQKAESMEAATLKGLWGDEPGQFSDSIWEALNARCAVEQARMLLTSRPYDFNWYKTEIYDKDYRLPGGDPDIEVVAFASNMNPGFPEEEWERQKRLHEGKMWKFYMKYGAVFTRPGGSVYEGWDDEWGICEPFVIPADWPRTWGVDFGPSHTAAAKAAQDPHTGMVYWYEEYEGGNIPSWQHVQALKRNEPKGSKVLAAGGAYSEDSWRNEWQTGGLDVQKPHTRLLDIGIDRTQDMVTAQCFRVFRTCPKIIEYFNKYSWETDEEGEPIAGKIANKDKWHVGDAVRYRNLQFHSPIEAEVKVHQRVKLDESQDDEPYVFTLW